MIAVTGGAGFIGSGIIWQLNGKGIGDILAVDETGNMPDEKKDNLKPLKFNKLIDKQEFLDDIKKIHRAYPIECIFHMGACSSTTEEDMNYLLNNNYEYTKTLAVFSAENNIRFIYASSAATYGDGSLGFSDDHGKLEIYRPLNKYGQSKHLFDVWAKTNGVLDKIAGLKYFNVYGPNEYHKGGMRSFVLKAFEQIKTKGRVGLFKSYKDEYDDGEQVRDFIYLKDAVTLTLWFYENKNYNGIYNIGSGSPKTWNDLVKSVFKALDKKEQIDYIEMPDSIKDQYQYYTCADTVKLKKTVKKFSVLSLDEGIRDYVINYLVPGRHLEI